MGQYFPAIHSVYNLVPERYFQIYFMTHKSLFTIAYISAGLYLTSYWPDKKVAESSESKLSKKEMVIDAQKKMPKKMNFMRGLTRLNFSIYMVNYFAIRTHFFTSRTMFYRSVSVIVSR